MTDEPARIVYERATVLLQALQPWGSHGEDVRKAAAELTLALAMVPDGGAA